jgi:hypothetical protein
MIFKILKLVGVSMILLSGAAAAVTETVSALTIGNSLLGSWTWWDYCGDGGGEVTQWNSTMICRDSAITGIAMYRKTIVSGATDLKGHWNKGTTNPEDARGQIASPTSGWAFDAAPQDVRDMLLAQGYFNYVVLQDDFLTASPNNKVLDTNFRYAGLFADLCLSMGSKPVFFAAWSDRFYQAANVTFYYDSLYRKYKSQGGLLLPVFHAMQLVLKDKDTAATMTYLHTTTTGSNDGHHPGSRLGYLQNCLYYELITHHSSVGFDLAAMAAEKSCKAGALALFTQADIDYIERIAHQAMLNVYGAGYFSSTAAQESHRPIQLSARINAKSRLFDIRGRAASGVVTGARGSVLVRRLQNGSSVVETGPAKAGR